MTSAEPVMFAFLSSACFGLAQVVIQFGLRHLPATAGALVGISTITVIFWALSPLLLDVDGWQTQAAAIFALVGLFFPAVVTLLTYKANERMGAMVASAAGSTAPLFAAAAAVVFLGERLTIPATIGTLTIVAGIVMLSWQPAAPLTRWPRRLVVLPLAAAALRGFAQAVMKIGLTLWPQPFAASLIGYTVSVASVVAGTRTRRASIQPKWTTKGVLWFGLVGICNGAAVLSMYAALSRGPVTLAAPTIATHPLFTLLFGTLLLPQQRPTPHLVGGTLLIVIGVAGLLVH